MFKLKNNQEHLYNLDPEAALVVFESSANGLSSVEASRRLKYYGLNVIQTKKEPFFKRLIEPFTSAFVLILLIAMGLSIVDQKAVDAAIIAAIVGINAIIYYFQQYSVGRVLNTLKRHDASFVHVVRNGTTVAVDSNQLTYGDVIHVNEGMKVPADGRLIKADQIEVDEALLTGESLPVHKQVQLIRGEKQLYDQLNMLFKGTYVRSGNGLLLVSGIGNNTRIGSITELAANADMGTSPIERKINVFTRKLMIVILIASLLALALSVWRGMPIDEALRFSLVIMVSAVPEGLPVALTIVLLLNARRMARVNALVKRMSSIETMGALTLIATDKTGTITENRLAVAKKHTTHTKTPCKITQQSPKLSLVGGGR